jgi:hypothetical protein
LDIRRCQIAGHPSRLTSEIHHLSLPTVLRDPKLPSLLAVLATVCGDPPFIVAFISRD